MPTDITALRADREKRAANGAGSPELGCGKPIKLTHLAELTAYPAVEINDKIFRGE